MGKGKLNAYVMFKFRMCSKVTRRAETQTETGTGKKKEMEKKTSQRIAAYKKGSSHRTKSFLWCLLLCHAHILIQPGCQTLNCQKFPFQSMCMCVSCVCCCPFPFACLRELEHSCVHCQQLHRHAPVQY